MSDDRRRRVQTATERDLAGQERLRKERDAAAEFVCEDVTGQYEGEALIAARERRAAGNPAARIALVETRLSGVEVGLARVEGKLEVLPELVSVVRQTADRAARRADVIVDTHVDISAAERKDAINARSDRRKFWFAIATAALTGGAIGKFLHWLGVF